MKRSTFLKSLLAIPAAVYGVRELKASEPEKTLLIIGDSMLPGTASQRRPIFIAGGGSEFLPNTDVFEWNSGGLAKL